MYIITVVVFIRVKILLYFQISLNKYIFLYCIIKITNLIVN